MLHELRLALRAHRRRPLFGLLVVALLALGIGANTTVLGVVDAVLLRPFPFLDQERLVMVRHRDLVRDVPFVEMSYPDFLDYRREAATFADLAAMPAIDSTFNLTGDGPPEVVSGRPVSGNFFDVLGVAPAIGRVFGPGERVKGGASAVILSHGFWRRRFGADPGIVGRTITLDGEAVPVIGVMPPAFAYPTPVDLWTSFEPGLAGIAEQRQTGWLLTIGRLSPEVTPEDATAELNTILDGLIDLHSPGYNADVVLTPLVDTIVGNSRPQVLAVAFAVTVLMLIAGANVAGLLLARATSRRREMATRLALGADRGRLARQLVIEGVPLAAAGSAAGLALAWWGTVMLRTTTSAGVPRLEAASLDWRLAAFATGLSVIVMVLASLVPARQAWRLGVFNPLRTSTVGDSRAGWRSARGALVVGQVALTVLLLVAAGLMLRSLDNYQRIDLGYEPDGLLTAELPLAGAAYADVAAANRFFDEVVARAGTLPGVESSAGIFLRPLWSTVGLDWPHQVEGQSPEDAQSNPPINLEAVTPGYFDTMRLEVVAGRAFRPADRADAQGVAIVSESFARRAWPDGNVAGRRVKMPLPNSPFSGEWLTVVGVVRDARYRAMDLPRLDVYMPAAQFPFALRHVVVRTSGDPARVADALRRAVLDLDPDQPLTDVRTMTAIVDDALGGRRLHTVVFVLFGVVAIGLAAIGLYAVLARLVEQRTSEIGVRVALGATRADIVRLVLGDGLRLTAAGLTVGLLASAFGMRVMASLVFGIATTDVASYAGALGVVLAASLAAGILPALRASRLDPTRAMKSQELC